MPTNPTEPVLAVEQVDRDAWEKYGPRIFHGELEGPMVLAAHRLTATAPLHAEIAAKDAEIVRLREALAPFAEMAKWLDNTAARRDAGYAAELKNALSNIEEPTRGQLY